MLLADVDQVPNWLWCLVLVEAAIWLLIQIIRSFK